MDSSTQSNWDKDLKDLHLVYDYNAKDADGNPEKWRYELWIFSPVRTKKEQQIPIKKNNLNINLHI